MVSPDAPKPPVCRVHQESYARPRVRAEVHRVAQENKSVIVGVNKFVSPSPKISELLRVNPEVEKRQKERLAEVKKNRDNDKANKALKNLEEVARSQENTMPAFIECVEAYASIGEICDVLRKAFGTQKEYLVF